MQDFSGIPNPAFIYVEDDLPSRQIMSILFRRVLNLSNVRIYENSANLVDKLADLHPLPAIFFIDIQMKPHDGYEVLHMLRANPFYANSTIIAMTANVMSHDVEKLKAAGFDGLIGKPIDQALFPQHVSRILQGQPLWFIP